MEELKHRAYYIARRYDRFWTKEESEAAEALMANGKIRKMEGSVVAEDARTSLAEFLQSKLRDPLVSELFQKGRERFYRDLVERLLRDHFDELHRCPRCNWLLPSESAKQCFECGYDWHVSNVPQPQGRSPLGGSGSRKMVD